MTTSARILSAAAMAGALALASAAGVRAQSADPHAGHGPVAGSASSKPGPLTDAVKAAIGEALRDELRGEAVYARVLRDHGDVRPFSNIVRAERRHAAFLEDLLKARGVAVPARPAGAEAPAYATVKEACTAAVELEKQNVALYDRLLAGAALPEDVKGVFEHNRVASLEHHEPAFERCAGLATAEWAGRGAGRGHGWRAGRGSGPGGGHGCGCDCGRDCGCGQGCGACNHGCGACRHGGGACRHGCGGCGHGCEGCGHGCEGCGHGCEGCGHGCEGCGQGCEACGHGCEACGHGCTGRGHGCAGFGHCGHGRGTTPDPSS